MEAIFLKILNLSITASWLVLVIIVLRQILKRAPKAIIVFMWALVGVRLICPFSIESIISLVPSVETVPESIIYSDAPTINSGVAFLNSTLNPIISEKLAPEIGESTNPVGIITFIASIIWIIGMALMFVYTLISYLRIHRKVREAVPYEDNIWLCDHIETPFIFGIIRTRIYLPSSINEQDIEYVIAHEKAHLVRHDHWWKPFGFIVLTVYWFNPVLWLSYVLLCKDIELACDEKVLHNMGNEIKKSYSEALINCSVPRKMISACPLAFGEVGVKGRVKSVLNYKKPAFWVILVAIITSCVVAVCFLTNPKTTQTTIDDELSAFIDMKIAEQFYSEKSDNENFKVSHHIVLDVEESSNETTVYMWVMYKEYIYKNGEINSVTGGCGPAIITVKREKLNGDYKLVEYWEPRNGSEYDKDIKKRFPLHLHSKVLGSHSYNKELKEFCENAAKEYYKTNKPTNSEVDNISLESLKEKYPYFFNVSTDGGMKVYIYQMSRNSYKCYLVNKVNDTFLVQDFILGVGATITEMRTILSSYDIERKDIVIEPINNPLSSYYYEIDETYCKKIEEIFWSEVTYKD